MNVAIRTDHLTKVYGRRVIAVNDMTLELPEGSICGLLGPNGAGKTTTLRLLLGLQRATAGYAEVLGHRCGLNSTTVRGLIGYLPTHPKLPGQLRPIEYLDLVGRICRLPTHARVPRLTAALQTVGLQDATSQRIRTFSTGMKTRLGIAASLLSDPPLLLWDEPTAGLDPAARRFVLNLIESMRGKRTVLVATHILSDIDRICDYVCVMHQGRMIFADSMQEMKNRLSCEGFVLEVDGRPAAVEQAVDRLQSLENVSVDFAPPSLMMVEVADGCSRAGALSAALAMIEAEGLTLRTIRSASSDTENAYLELLREEETHGFHRFSF